MKTVQHNFKKIIVILAVLVGINIAGHFIFKRFDLTADKRYTLSETSLQIVDEIKYLALVLQVAEIIERNRIKKSKNITGTEASYLVNLFDDIISLKLIDEDTLLGSQKKSLKTVFHNNRVLIDLLINEIEELQVKVVNTRDLPMTELTEEEKLAMNIKGVWPNWKDISVEKKLKETEEQALIEANKRPRGRPPKSAF